MKLKSWNFFISTVVLALAAMACATPDVNALLNPLPKDDFSSSSSGWGTATDNFKSVEYANDGLQMIVYEPYYVTWSAPDTTYYENVHMDVKVTNQGADPEALFGFICNEEGTTNNFYYVGVSPDGYYAFIKSSIAADDVFLKEGTSDMISSNPIEMNLGLDCKNGSMTLYVNGQAIDTVSDSTYTTGVIGLFAASDDIQTGTSVLFDDFVVTKIGE